MLTEAEQVIFNLIQNNDGITKSEMAVRIGKSEKTVQRIISSLTKKNVIEREGSNRTGRWKVKTGANTDDTVYNNWYQSVYESPAPEPRKN